MAIGEPDSRTSNALTVDVEEHFQVSAFAEVVDRDDWESIPSRVDANTDRLLDLFDRAGVKATFFLLGWVADRKPSLVRRIADRGHEIGCHGYSHRLVYDQQPAEFREEARRAKRVLEELSGQAVTGYRAASFSITRRSLWAVDILVECGFRYDSSVFPVHHDRYGIPGAPRRIFRLRTVAGNSIVEVPPATLRLGRAVIPVAGGGYLRIFPIWFTRWAIRRLNRVERMPAVVYLHPWEVDPRQPRIRAAWKSRLRHYSRLASTEGKLAELLRCFRFEPLGALVGRDDAIPERRVA